MTAMCPLCEAERLTEWFHEDNICYCCLCKSCNVPMVVLKRHSVAPGFDESGHALSILQKVAEKFFGSRPFYVDSSPRSIEDHWHVHAREIH